MAQKIKKLKKSALRDIITYGMVTVLFIVFQSLDSKPTDWNDLVVREGGASARAVLAGQGLSLMGSRQPMGHGVGTSTDARKSVAMSR